MENPKPCPFCGGDKLKIYVDDWGEPYIFCEGCFVSFGLDDTEANLIKLWNKIKVED